MVRLDARGVPGHDLARLERRLRVRGQLRLHADDPRAGRSAAIAAATPAASPPPPTGTRTAATSGRSSAISSPTVPWPATIRGSSNGGMIAEPALRGEPLGDEPPLLGGGPDDDDLGAVRLDPRPLDRGRVARA